MQCIRVHGRASEMHQKSTEFNTQGCTLTVTCQTLQLLISQAIIFALGVLVALEGLLLLLWAFKLIALFPLMPTSSSSKYRIMINMQLSEVKSCQALRTQR